MKPHSLRFLPVVLLILAVVTAAAYYYKSTAQTRQYMLQALTTQTAPQATDAELRLALLAQELRTNPHFSLSQADLNVLRVVLTELQSDSMGFGELYASQEDKQVLIEHFYPIDFLRSVIETESMRRRFIENPTAELARSYFDALKVTTLSYKDYLTKLDTFIATSEQFPYGLIDGSVSNESLSAWFSDLQKRADAADSWAALQIECLQSYQKECTSKVAHSYQDDIREGTSSSYNESELSFSEKFAVLESLYAPVGGNGEQFSDVPIIEYRGYCSHDSQAQYARVWWNKLNNTDLNYTRFLYADDVLFFNHYKNNTQFSKFLIEHGIPYQHQPVNHYLCNHYGSDTTAITTTYGIWHYVKNKEVSNSTPDSLVKLREAENIIKRATSTVKHLDVVNYMTEVDAVLSNTGQNDLSEDERRELEEISLAYRDGSLFYEERLTSLLKLYEFTYANFRRLAIPNPEYIIIGFSAMPMTLLADNPMVQQQASLPALKYPLDEGYPNLISGLDTLQTISDVPLDPIEYLEHTLDVIVKLKKQEI